MTDDEYEYLGREIEREVSEGRKSVWRGVFEGGPLDGAEFSIDAPPHLGMRGMRLQVCIGDDVPESKWHIWRFGQRLGGTNSIETHFRHLGVLEGDPEPP